MITNGATFAREIKPRMALAIKALNKKKAPFTSQLGLKFKAGTGKVLNLNFGFVWC